MVQSESESVEVIISIIIIIIIKGPAFWQVYVHVGDNSCFFFKLRFPYFSIFDIGQ